MSKMFEQHELDTLVREYLSRKSRAEQAAKSVAEYAQKIIEAIDATGQTVHRAPDGKGGEAKVTVIRSEVVVTDYAALKKVLSKETWAKIVKEVVDPKLVEAAVAIGDIKAEAVADVSELRTNKPYVKVSGDYDPYTLGEGRPLLTPKPRTVKGRRRAIVPPAQPKVG